MIRCAREGENGRESGKGRWSLSIASLSIYLSLYPRRLGMTSMLFCIAWGMTSLPIVSRGKAVALQVSRPYGIYRAPTPLEAKEKRQVGFHPLPSQWKGGISVWSIKMCNNEGV